MANISIKDHLLGIWRRFADIGGGEHAEVIAVVNPDGTPIAGGSADALTNTQLRATPVPVQAQARTCLGCLPLALSAVTVKSLTDAGAIPAGAVVAEIQADGGVVRLRRDAAAPTATVCWRIDDGMSVPVDSALASVRLLAQSGTTTSVQIAYFDRV